MKYLHLVPWSPRTTYGGYETIIRDAAKMHARMGYGSLVVGRRNDDYIAVETHEQDGVGYVEFVDSWKRRPSTLDVGIWGIALLIAEIIYSHIVLTPIVLWQIYTRKIDVVIFYGIHLFLMSPVLRAFGAVTLLGLEVIQKQPHAKKGSLLYRFRQLKYACFSGVFTYTKIFRFRDGSSVDNEALLASFTGKRRMLYVPWGIDVQAIKKTPQSSYIQSLRKKSKHIIICPRRLVEEKGVRHLLEAVASIRSRVKDVVVVFAGDGVLRGQLERRVSELRLRKHVRFTGFVPHAEALQMIRSSDVTVVPSSGEESFGMVFLESFALSTPVVTTWFGGITNVVSHKKTGIVVDPGSPEQLADAIVDVLTDRALSDRLVKNAQHAVSKTYELTRTLKTIDSFAKRLS